MGFAGPGSIDDPRRCAKKKTVRSARVFSGKRASAGGNGSQIKQYESINGDGSEGKIPIQGGDAFVYSCWI